MSRMATVGEQTVVSASGDIGDFQHMQDMLEDLVCVSTRCCCTPLLLGSAPSFVLPKYQLRPPLTAPHFLTRRGSTVSTENHEKDDGFKLTPKAVHTYLTRIMYNK